MSIFSEVTLTWGEKEYNVPSDKVLGLVNVIEEFVVIEDLTTGRPPRARIAQAYAAAIKYAGGYAKPEDVYVALFNAEDQKRIFAVIDALLCVMIPPESLRKLMPKAEDGAPKKTESGE